MLSFLPHPVRGVLALLIVGLNTVFWCGPLFAVALLKVLVPVRRWRDACTRLLMGIATAWVSINSAGFGFLHRIHWDVEGVEALEPHEWYLVVSNHQSWVDIPVVQKALNRRIPMLKFFLKQELIWVPVLGLAWWALDFPFMKRYPRARMRDNPALAGVDLERTRRACARFRSSPVAVFNFLEGTRFSEEKRERQASPYQHLLKPRAGGAAFVLGALGEQMRTLLDVTVVYPRGQPKMWHLLAGYLDVIRVRVRAVDIPADFCGRDYREDEAFRSEFQAWIRALWQEKDALIARIRETEENGNR
jgi:1-acyl-sn-glycerol-3-phosphate acyltransferase